MLQGRGAEGATTTKGKLANDAIKVNGLTFKRRPDGQYVCEDLKDLRRLCNERYTPKDIDALIDRLSQCFRISERTMPGADAEVRAKAGAALYKQVMESSGFRKLEPFSQILFALGDWWYYQRALRRDCDYPDDHGLSDKIREELKKFIIPLLPAPLREELKEFDAANCAVNGDRFAILFVNKGGGSARRLITDSQAIELPSVHGYSYLDIDKKGRVLARCCTNREGGRAFFDGDRLMSHETFMTCAPKTIFFEGGYKFNSTGCSVANGCLYPLLEADDPVSWTTGFQHTPFGVLKTFNGKEAMESYAKSDASAAELKVTSTGDLVYKGETLKPRGVFRPSKVTLLPSGFSLYDWSEFVSL